MFFINFKTCFWKYFLKELKILTLRMNNTSSLRAQILKSPCTDLCIELKSVHGTPLCWPLIQSTGIYCSQNLEIPHFDLHKINVNTVSFPGALNQINVSWHCLNSKNMDSLNEGENLVDLEYNGKLVLGRCQLWSWFGKTDRLVGWRSEFPKRTFQNESHISICCRRRRKNASEAE
jgi:hypothetical protein